MTVDQKAKASESQTKTWRGRGVKSSKSRSRTLPAGEQQRKKIKYYLVHIYLQRDNRQWFRGGSRTWVSKSVKKFIFYFTHTWEGFPFTLSETELGRGLLMHFKKYLNIFQKMDCFKKIGRRSLQTDRKQSGGCRWWLSLGVGTELMDLEGLWNLKVAECTVTFDVGLRKVTNSSFTEVKETFK